MTVEGSPRLPYADLPRGLRAAIDSTLSSAVVRADGCTGGFSPGTAAVLSCADGTRAFVKAVGTPLNPDTVDLHRAEARIAAALPPTLPTPRFRGSIERVEDGATWIALLFDAVGGASPSLPWSRSSATAVLDSLAALAGAGTPCPVPGLGTVAERLAGELAAWERLAADPPADLDAWERRHLDRLAAVPERLAAAGGLGGNTLVHLDVRADNLLVDADGAVLLVDWPWAARGAPWIDSVLFALDPVVHGGVDPEDLVAGSPVVGEADPAAVTDLLLGLTGTWAEQMRRPAPPGLPTLRAFQRLFHDSALTWARRRLGAGEEPPG